MSNFTPPDPNTLMMGTGSRSAKFETPGDKVQGEIVDIRTSQQTDPGTGKPKFWDNGDPMWQVVITIQTGDSDEADDDGKRAIYVKGGKKRQTTEKAITDAVKAAGARFPEVGGILGVAYTGDGVKTNPAFNAPKEYVATYKAPTAAANLDAIFADDKPDAF